MFTHLDIFYFFHTKAFSHPDLWLFLASWFGLALVLTAVVFVSFHKHSSLSILKGASTHIKEWLTLLIIPFGTLGIVQFLKFMFHQPRPFMVLDIIPLSMPGMYDSFPSGHAAFYMALALGVYYHHKRAGTVLISGAIIVAIARIVIGVHFPIDIVGGWLVALLVYKLVSSAGKKMTM